MSRFLRRCVVVAAFLGLTASPLAPLLRPAVAADETKKQQQQPKDDRKGEANRDQVAAARNVPPSGVVLDSATASFLETASVDELKSEAFKALRSGEFGRSNELLERAAARSQDPVLVRMAGWTHDFESQRQEFAAERRKQYDE